MMKRLIAAIAVGTLLVACGGRPTGPAVQASARYATAAAVVDDVVYVVGGIERGPTGDVTVAVVEAYDPDARTWTGCAPMATARSFTAAAAFEGRIYVFGGLDGAGNALDSVEAYDPRTNVWSACAPMDSALSRLAAVRHMRGGIIVAGGLDAHENNSARQRIYLPSEGGIWRDWAPPFSSGRHGLGLVDADDGSERIFVVGGYDDDGPLDVVDWFGVGTVHALDEDGKPRWGESKSTDSRTGVTTTHPNDQDYQGYDWWAGPPLKQARGFHAVARIERRIYAVGGRCPTIPRTEILDIDALQAGWQQGAPLPKDLCRFSLVEWDGHLLAFGGETEFGKLVNTDVFEYDPATDTWSVR